VENAGSTSYGKPKHLVHFGIKYARLLVLQQFSHQSTTPKEACFVVMIAHKIVTTVADDSIYTFHRRHRCAAYACWLLILDIVLMTTMMMMIITSPSLSHSGRVTSPSLTAENGLARCMCYYLCNAHCRRVQSLSRRYATSTPQCHVLPIRYTALSVLPKKKFAPSRWGYSSHRKNIILQPTQPTTPYSIIGD